MPSIVLNPAATRAYEAHAVRRAELGERIDELLAEADRAEEEMFREIAELQGLDLARSWDLNADHYEEFGVVLMTEIDEPDEDDYDEPPAEARAQAIN